MELTKHWALQLDDYAIDLAWSPDGGTLAAASAAGPVILAAAADGARLHELTGHPDGTNALAFAPGTGNGDAGAGLSLLATGGQDGCVRLWDAGAGHHVATAELGRGWVEHLGWRPKAKGQAGVAKAEAGTGAGSNGGGTVLAATCGRALVFVGPDGMVRQRFPDAQKTLTALAWEPGGGCAAAACFGAVTLWDADDGVKQKEYAYGNGIHALAWSPDGSWLVSGNQDPSVHLWKPAEDIELQMSGYDGKVRHLSFDSTGRWLATSGGTDACLWDCSGAGPEGRDPVMLPHDAPVCAVAFQGSHGLLASASQDGALMLWSPERRQPLRATIKLPGAVTRLAWSPDDRHLAIGSDKGVVYVLRCVA